MCTENKEFLKHDPFQIVHGLPGTLRGKKPTHIID